MAFDSDYSPVAPYEDEEDRLRDRGYAPVTAATAPIPSAAPGGAGYAPVYPATPGMGSTQDLEARAARPKTYTGPETTPPTPAPKWSDYAPPEPHGWAKFGHIMAGLSAPTNYWINQRPERQAELRYKNAVGEYEAPIGEAEKKAETEQKTSQAELEHEQAENLRNPQPKPPTNDFELWARQNPDKPVGDWLKLQNENKPDKPDTQVQRKQAIDAVTAKLDKAGLPTDPKHLSGSLDRAKAQGIITPDEHAAVTSFQTTDATPSTNLTVRVQGAEAANAMKEAGKTYLYNGELVKGDKVPKDADALYIKDPQAFHDEARNADIVMKSFNHLINDDARIFDDPKARAVLATALDDRQAQQLGLLVMGTGGSISLPGGTGKVIDQILENNAVPQNLRRDVKDYIVDYWAMKDKIMMVQMQMQNGKIGRGNQAYFQAMLAQLPGPATSDSTMARRSFRDLSETLSGLREKYGNLPKETPAKIEGSVGGGGTDYGDAGGKPEGSTGTMKDGTKVVVKGGRIIAQ